MSCSIRIWKRADRFQGALSAETDDPPQDCRFFANKKLRVSSAIRGVFCAVLRIFFAVSDFCDIIGVVRRAIHATAFAEFATLSDCPVSGGKHRASNGRRPGLTQKLDCAAQNPTAFNLFMLLRFKSSEECTYRSSVMVVVACPSTSESDLISKPTSTARVAKV